MKDQIDIYGEKRAALEALAEELLDAISDFRAQMKERNGDDPVEHVECRIKSDESMREKLRRKELAETTENALYTLHDALGIRVVCSFLKDVYAVRDHLASLPGFEAA